MSDYTELQVMRIENKHLLQALEKLIHSVRTCGVALTWHCNEELKEAMKTVEEAGGENKI